MSRVLWLPTCGQLGFAVFEEAGLGIYVTSYQEAGLWRVLEDRPKDKSGSKARKWLGRETGLNPPAPGEKAKAKGLVLEGLREQLSLQE